MKLNHFLKLCLFLFFGFLLSACTGAGDEADVTPPAKIEGPAFVLFYTDN